MSLDERSVLADEHSNSQHLALTQITTVSQPVASWTKPLHEDPNQFFNITDLSTYLHAVRRHWVLALGLGLLLAAVLGPLVWYGMGALYTANAYLRVSYQEKALVYSGVRMSETEYDIFKNTQIQLIRNRFVLSAALRKPGIKDKTILKKQQDPVSWLMGNLSVSFPLKAEVMEISLTTYNAQEAADIVTAVLEAFMTEVIDAETAQRRQRISELERVQTTKEGEVRNRRSELKQLAEQLGTAETEALNLKQKLTLEELANYRQELVRNQFEIGRLRGQLASLNAELRTVEDYEISDLECEMFAPSDPTLRSLSQQIVDQKLVSEYTSGALAPGAKSSRFASRYESELSRVEKDYSQRMEEIREEIRRKQKGQVEREIKRVEATIDVANKQQQTNDEEVTRLKKLAEQFGSSSIDVEMLRGNIENLDKSLKTIMDEREKLRVELNSASRITPYGPPKAEKPQTPSNFTARAALTVMVSLIGLCMPIGLIVLWDIQFQRINAPAEVSSRLGIPVIGSMPVIPSRVLRQLGSSSKRNQIWQLRLTESVDGITARLLRRPDLEQRRVIMVTRAISGEGKTTLAAQLAMSLARAGRRTVVVDFDLRQPTFDEAFGLLRSPGVSEILRSESDLVATIQSTATNNLSVITAGRWNRAALSALANGAASSFFKELREDFEFVIIDTSPILPIADARFVSQYVDSVVLCVFRDISEAPRIRAACEILEAFGVQCIEAAVTSASQSDNRRSGSYSSNVSA